MKKLALALCFLVFTVICQSQTPCTNGFAGSYPCNDYDLMSRISLSQMNASAGNDSWGWTDPQTSKEYAIIGLNNGTAFIDISNPTNPIYLGKLPTATSNSSWRDVKVYSDHAFIVSEASNHGMQVFDLTRLRNVSNPPATFTADTRYTEFGNAHNIVINEGTGYAYVVGAQRNSGTYRGGPLFINIQDPKNPVNAGGFLSGGQRAYTHDAQVVTYNGPDTDYTGREILIGSNEIEVVIADITNKSNPTTIATIKYSDIGYTHQGWFTEDQRYFILGDETDEQGVGFNTRTIIFDFQDLDNPLQHMTYNGPTAAIDHNGYVKGNLFYLANYRAGIRVIDISDIGNKNMTEVGFFDTFSSSNSASFNGVWNVYPYFDSGNIVISDIEGGFFLVRKSEPGGGGGDDCSSTVSSFPFVESFETNLGQWTNSTTGDDIDWTRTSGSTPSSNTGPSGAADGNTYVYVEASGNGTGFPNKRAILNAPCLNFSNLVSPSMTFQYHMLGSAINTLNVEARINNEGAWNSVFSRNGSQGNNWNTANIDLTAYAGAISVQLRFNVVTGTGNQGWQSDIAIDAVSIQNSTTDPDVCPSLNFNDFQITSFSNQDAAGDFSTTTNGASLLLSNNTWKSIPFNYTVTANTVIEFEFASSSQGEIHAIGFENDNTLTSNRYFKVHGTQNYGVTNYDTYNSGLEKYVIPVGSFYTGVMDRLVFINDNDAGSGNQSTFSLVKIYESSCGNLNTREIAGANIVPIFGNEDENILAMKIYPNPVSGSSLSLFVNTDLQADYEIIGLQGQLLSKGIVTENIDVSNLNAGVYFLRVTSADKVNSMRFIKK